MLPFLLHIDRSIVGRVSDIDNLPLEGVTVTVSSPSLIGGTATTYTDEDGNYRFPVLAPGLYEVTASLQGFQTAVRNDVRVSVGKTVTVNHAIGQTMEEAIEVSAETALVDSTTPASPKTVDIGVIENLPKFSFALDRSLLDIQRTGLYFISASAESPGGRIVQWNQNNPVLRFVDAGLWRFSHVSVLKIPAGAEILMETSEGPVAYSDSSLNQRKIVIGFSLDDSNVVLLAGFPVFLQNSIEWLATDQRSVVPVLTGGPYRKEGTVEQSGARGYVNFADAVESNITPQKIQGTSSFDSGGFKGRTDLTTWFLILLILILILEWWVFHRRIEATL